ncbi:GAF domain-containing sensor histidine kinase [Actinopolymorpha sp. B11F2]|uniref:GAF domain-containing sensor histidine kinase n=1 Tax=Actinopolymorpha sp. B11F2 TaxID=3160862 RepID=UPI0032E484AE
MLVDIIEVASSGLSLEDLAPRVAPLIAAATGTDACLLFALDDLDLEASQPAGAGRHAAGLDAAGQWLTLRGATPPYDRGVGRVRIRLGEALPEAGRVGLDPDAEAYMSMVSVPMTSSPGGIVGALSVYTRARRNFTDGDVRLLTSIGSLIASGTHARHLRRRLAARERAHERFTEQAIAAQEAERRRLAADIHDGITQRLCSLRFHLDAAADALTSEPDFASEQLVVARTLARLTLDEARAAINGLRPPVLDDLGLADSLASLARTTPGIGVVVEVDVDECALPEHVEIALYRIAQEALQNAVTHADASTIRLQLRRTGEDVALVVADDGRGWDEGGRQPAGNGRESQAAGRKTNIDGPESHREPRDGAVARDGPDAGDPDRGYGLRSMAERAELIGGRLFVVSRVGEGTTVTARVSLT